LLGQARQMFSSTFRIYSHGKCWFGATLAVNFDSVAMATLRAR
jgi:hypothetical protein